MYLRPTMIATAAALGVQKPKEALLYIIACCFPSFDTPSGTAGPNGNMIQQPSKARPGLKLLASKEDTVRAWPGGFGYAKVGANYGPSLMAQAEARARGFDQVLWLLGKECNVTEAVSALFGATPSPLPPESLLQRDHADSEMCRGRAISSLSGERGRGSCN